MLNLGSVTITFDDHTVVNQNVDSIGDTWFDQNSSRRPVRIDALDQSWQIVDLPAAITYPNGDIGKLSMTEINTTDPDTVHEWIIVIEPDRAQ